LNTSPLAPLHNGEGCASELEIALQLNGITKI
jgi:hypothetical protein